MAQRWRKRRCRADRENYPQALIVVHTSDAVALNVDSANPYREQGVEVVSKRAWHAISGVMRRKLIKSRFCSGGISGWLFLRGGERL